jgi:hypothetical protein
MVQKIDLKHMPTKSRAWIEAERLKLARGCLGGNNPLRRNQTTAPERCGAQLEGCRYCAAAVAVDQRRGVTTSIQTAAFEWCKWGRRSAQSTWESRPQPTPGEALPWRGSFWPAPVRDCAMVPA